MLVLDVVLAIEVLLSSSGGGAVPVFEKSSIEPGKVNIGGESENDSLHNVTISGSRGSTNSGSDFGEGEGINKCSLATPPYLNDWNFEEQLSWY